MHAIEKKLKGEEIETTDLKQLEVLLSLPSLLLTPPVDWSNQRERENGSQAIAEVTERRGREIRCDAQGAASERAAGSPKEIVGKEVEGPEIRFFVESEVRAFDSMV